MTDKPNTTIALDDESLIAHDGGGSPVARLTVVEAHFRGASLKPMVMNAAKLTWRHSAKDPDRDIVAYRIVRPSSAVWRK